MRRAGVLLAVGVVALTACSSSGSGSRARAAVSTAASSTTAGPTTTTIDPTADRPYDMVVPDSYSAGTPTPLVLLLHGYGATGVVQNAYFGLEPVVKAREMLYVHPDGTKNSVGKQFWNATDACCAPPGSEVDDDAYLMAIIDQVSAKYTVDPKRIYLVGHSNGAFMSFRMACRHADRIAAIVSLAGATFADPSQCTPSEPVSVLHMHGTADGTITYTGGAIGGRKYPGAEDTVAAWAKLDGCSGQRVATAGLTDTTVSVDGPDTTVSTYGGCARGSAVTLWSVAGAPHIPFFTPTTAAGFVDFLLAHPKR